ncbi:glycine cleavage system protein H [candidate division KSB1 bacterium]|nr:glycine cleavage system protein H [candidate division KSB1 bacterium]
MNLMQSKRKKFQIIPQSDKKCVWMEAGIVSYKICDRDFQCETCPLDIGLKGDDNFSLNYPTKKNKRAQKDNKNKRAQKDNKNERAQKDNKNQKNFSIDDSSCERFFRYKLDEKCFVNSGHCWTKVLNKNTVRIGIDDIVATALGSIDDVILPSPGEKITRGSSCGQVIQFEHIFSIVSPVCGKVLNVNTELVSIPNQVTLDPLNKGWLLDIKPENLEQDLKYCRSGDALLSWYLKEIKWLESNLAMGFQQENSNIGITLTDGGEISRNLRNYLPKDNYRRLILSMLGLPDSSRQTN